jgi:hypothetical protein
VCTLVQATDVPEQDTSRNESLHWLTYCEDRIFVYIDVKEGLQKPEATKNQVNISDRSACENRGVFCVCKVLKISQTLKQCL